MNLKKLKLTPAQEFLLRDLRQENGNTINPAYKPLQVLLKHGLVEKIYEGSLGFPRYKATEAGKAFKP